MKRTLYVMMLALAAAACGSPDTTDLFPDGGDEASLPGNGVKPDNGSGMSNTDSGKPDHGSGIAKDGGTTLDATVSDASVVDSGQSTLCRHGLDYCGGACVDLQNDPENCGWCGVVCFPGTSCQLGECRIVGSATTNDSGTIVSSDAGDSGAACDPATSCSCCLDALTTDCSVPCGSLLADAGLTSSGDGGSNAGLDGSTTSDANVGGDSGSVVNDDSGATSDAGLNGGGDDAGTVGTDAGSGQDAGSVVSSDGSSGSSGDDASSVADGSSSDGGVPDSGSTSSDGSLSDGGVAPTCVYTQGFWKTHPSAWPTQALDIGATWYTEQQCLTILSTPPNHDASLILAHQLIAAVLNGGAYLPQVAVTIGEAEEWMADNGQVLPYGTPVASAAGQRAVDLAAVLDAYNNGKLDVPSCN